MAYNSLQMPLKATIGPLTRVGARNLFDPPLRRGGGSKPTRKQGDGRFKIAKTPVFLNLN